VTSQRGFGRNANRTAALPDAARAHYFGWIGSAGSLSIALLLGRLSGLFRELQLASALGVSRNADLAVLLLTLPDLLVGIILAGGVSATLVPSLRTLNPPTAAAQFRQSSMLAAVGFSLLAIVLVVFPRGVMRVIAPGLVVPSDAIGMKSFAAVAVAIPLTALAGVTSAYLNARDRFFVAGCGTLVFNLCVLVALALSMLVQQPLPMLCGGIVLGALLRWLMQLAAVPREAWTIQTTYWQLDVVFLRRFSVASLIGPGYIAMFNYALKIVELPSGVLISAISTVALPYLSSLHAAGNTLEARKAANFEIRRAVLLGVTALLPATWFADAIVTVLFGRGQMTLGSLTQIVQLTRIALCGIPFIAVSSMAATALYAQGRTAAVLRATGACLCVLAIFCGVGFWRSSPAWLMWGVVGFQAALAFALLNCARLSLFTHEELRNSAITNSLLASLALSCLTVAFDWGIGSTNPFFRLAWAGGGFSIALWCGLKVLGSRHPTTD
jgi:putative peptidoglycan lipid II flippase